MLLRLSKTESWWVSIRCSGFRL